MFKLPKLKRATDYIQWKRHEKVCRRKDYYAVLSHRNRPEDAEEYFLEDWNEKNAKAKCTIILTPGYFVFALANVIVDDDNKSENLFCEELRRLYTTSITR